MSFVAPQSIPRVPQVPRSVPSTKTVPVCRKPLKGRGRLSRKGPSPVSVRPKTELPPYPTIPQRHLKLARGPLRKEDNLEISKVLDPIKQRRDLILETSSYHDPGALATIISVRDRMDHTLIITTTRDTTLIAAHEVRMCQALSKKKEKEAPIIVAAGNKVPGGWQHPAINANNKKYPVIVIASVQACIHDFLLNNHGRKFLQKVKFLIIVDVTGIVEIGSERTLARILKATNPKEFRKNVVLVRHCSNNEKRQKLNKLISLISRKKYAQVKWDGEWSEEQKENFYERKNQLKQRYKFVGKTFSETLKLRFSSKDSDEDDQSDKLPPFSNFSKDIFSTLDSFLTQNEEKREKRLEAIDSEEATFNVLSIPEDLPDDINYNEVMRDYRLLTTKLPLNSSYYLENKNISGGVEEGEDGREDARDFLAGFEKTQTNVQNSRKPHPKAKTESKDKENTSLYLERLEFLSSSPEIHNISEEDRSSKPISTAEELTASTNSSYSSDETEDDSTDEVSVITEVEEDDEDNEEKSEHSATKPGNATTSVSKTVKTRTTTSKNSTPPLPVARSTFNVDQQIVIGHWGRCYRALIELLQETVKTSEGEEHRTIVIFPTGRLVDCYATMVRADGYEVYDVHRRSTPGKRERVFDWFNVEKRGILFCTDVVTSDGVLLPPVNRLIQFGVPHLTDDYYSRLNLVLEGQGDSYLLTGESNVDKILEHLGIGHIVCRPVDDICKADASDIIWTGDGLDMKAKAKAYLSLTSFWILQRSHFEWNKRQVIDYVNEWAVETFGEVPQVPSNLAKRLNIKRLSNVNVDIIEPPPPRVRAKKQKKKKKASKTGSKSTPVTNEKSDKISKLVSTNKVTEDPWSQQ